jgi:hypothetical protein
MSFTFSPAFLWGLGELPVVEAGTEAGSDGLGDLCAVVMAKAMICESERLWEEPAVAVVLGAEGLDAPVSVSGLGNGDLEGVEGDEGEDGVAEFGILIFVHTPEALGVEGAAEGLVVDAFGGVVAVLEDPGEVVTVEAIEDGDHGVEHGAEAEAFMGGRCPEPTPRYLASPLFIRGN